MVERREPIKQGTHFDGTQSQGDPHVASRDVFSFPGGVELGVLGAD
jgi:hypothetical protein